jgi:L-alanine-DL-glutamate epimerase-like enolase superfamily enzyme
MVQDLDGHARVAKATGIPVAGGEHIYSKHVMREAFSKDAFNYAQPDAMRIGGITELCKVVGMAESWFIPVVPHGASEIHAQVALAHSAESMPFVELLTDSEEPLLKNVLYTDYEPPKNGKIVAGDRPGLGYTLNEDAIKEYTVTD